MGRAKAGAACFAGGGGIHLGEFLEDVFQFIGWDADAGIVDADQDMFILAPVTRMLILPLFGKFHGSC